jgi:hypothetical protein
MLTHGGFLPLDAAPDPSEKSVLTTPVLMCAREAVLRAIRVRVGPSAEPGIVRRRAMGNLIAAVEAGLVGRRLRVLHVLAVPPRDAQLLHDSVDHGLRAPELSGDRGSSRALEVALLDQLALGRRGRFERRVYAGQLTAACASPRR